MKKLFFLLALAIAVKVSYASPGEIKFDNPSQIQTTESLSMDSPAISFIAYWSLGDSYLYKVTKSEKLWKEGLRGRWKRKRSYRAIKGRPYKGG